MSDVIIPYRFLVRGGTAAAIAALNEIPRARELVFETDTLKFKLGDGVTHYNSLDYAGTVEAADIHYNNAAGGLAATNVQSAIDELTDEKLDDAPIDGTNYGRKDGAWTAIAGGGGSGDVVGPTSSVNNRVAFFDGTTGKLLKDSGLTLSGSNTGDQNLAPYGVLANPLSQFAATTSAQLAGVMTDETGSGALVFANAPTLVNPVVGTQSAADNSTKAASTAYVDTAISSLTGSGATDIRDVWLFG